MASSRTVSLKANYRTRDKSVAVEEKTTKRSGSAKCVDFSDYELHDMEACDEDANGDEIEMYRVVEEEVEEEDENADEKKEEDDDRDQEENEQDEKRASRNRDRSSTSAASARLKLVDFSDSGKSSESVPSSSSSSSSSGVMSLLQPMIKSITKRVVETYKKEVISSSSSPGALRKRKVVRKRLEPSPYLYSKAAILPRRPNNISKPLTASAPSGMTFGNASRSTFSVSYDEPQQWYMALGFRVLTTFDDWGTRLKYKCTGDAAVGHVELVFQRPCLGERCRYRHCKDFTLNSECTHVDGSYHLVVYSVRDMKDNNRMLRVINRCFSTHRLYEFYAVKSTEQESLAAEEFVESQLGAYYMSYGIYWNSLCGGTRFHAGPSRQDVVKICLAIEDAKRNRRPLAGNVPQCTWTCSSICTAVLIAIGKIDDEEINPGTVLPQDVYKFVNASHYDKLWYQNGLLVGSEYNY